MRRGESEWEDKEVNRETEGEWRERGVNEKMRE
jgi:hypothetical protein